MKKESSVQERERGSRERVCRVRERREVCKEVISRDRESVCAERAIGGSCSVE